MLPATIQRVTDDSDFGIAFYIHPVKPIKHWVLKNNIEYYYLGSDTTFSSRFKRCYGFTLIDGEILRGFLELVWWSDIGLVDKYS